VHGRIIIDLHLVPRSVRREVCRPLTAFAFLLKPSPYRYPIGTVRNEKYDAVNLQFILRKQMHLLEQSLLRKPVRYDWRTMDHESSWMLDDRAGDGA
jgi:hypothetical protein